MSNTESATAARAAIDPPLRETALRLLAQREHSRFELSRKLQPLSPQSELIEILLDELSTKNYLNDARFAEAYVHMRMHKGMGPLKIGYELRLKGVDASLITTALQSIDWDAQLLELFLRKQRPGLALSPKEREKQQRFWQQRGFGHEQIRHLLKRNLSSTI